MLGYIVVPFLSNYIDRTIAQWVWFPCAAYVLISTVIDCVKKTKCFEDPLWNYITKQGDFPLLLTFSSVFVFNYYEIGYVWCWVIFIALAVYVPVFFVSALKFDFTRNVRSDAEKRKARINIIKHIICYWIFDFFFCACFNNWSSVTYFLGTIAIVIILWNATKAFLSGNELFWWLLPFEFLIGIGLSVYLIYFIADESLRGIVLTMAAAVYGGLFTLIGVAWTIKKGDTDRRADLRRMEDERRAEERKKHIPFLRVTKENQGADVARVISIKGLSFGKLEDVALLNNRIFYEVTINAFNVKNISKEAVILKGIIVHGAYYSFTRAVIIEAGGTCKIEITKNYSVIFAELDKMMTLVVEDILGNQYSIGCRITLSTDSSRHIVCENEQGEFIGFWYSYIVESIELPALVNIDTERGS